MESHFLGDHVDIPLGPLGLPVRFSLCGADDCAVIPCPNRSNLSRVASPPVSYHLPYWGDHAVCDCRFRYHSSAWPKLDTKPLNTLSSAFSLTFISRHEASMLSRRANTFYKAITTRPSDPCRRSRAIDAATYAHSDVDGEPRSGDNLRSGKRNARRTHARKVQALCCASYLNCSAVYRSAPHVRESVFVLQRGAPFRSRPPELSKVLVSV